jgi:hypothetical protein
MEVLTSVVGNDAELEEVVAGMWTVASSTGESLGPLVGGLLSDVVPATPEVDCGAARCASTFPWSAFTYACLAGGLCAGLILGEVHRGRTVIHTG